MYTPCTLYSVHCMNTVLFLALLFLFTPGEKHLTSPTFSVIHFLNIRTLYTVLLVLVLLVGYTVLLVVSEVSPVSDCWKPNPACHHC